MDWTPLFQAIATADVALVGIATVVAIILLARHNAAVRVDLRKLLGHGASDVSRADLIAQEESSTADLRTKREPGKKVSH